MTNLSRITLLIVLLSLLAGCGSKSIAGGEMRKIASVKYGGSYDAAAVDGNGGVLVAWHDGDGSYERYAPPGKGWSKTQALAGGEEGGGLAYGDSLAFDGRGERLAVLEDKGNLLFDVRRQGAKEALLRASATLPDDYYSEGVSITASSACGFLVTVAGKRTAKNNDEYFASFAFLVRCSPRWRLTAVENKVGFYQPVAVFDDRGRPALFWMTSPFHGYFETPPWERLFYATIDSTGRVRKPRSLAFFRPPHMPDLMEMKGARDPVAVMAWKSVLWRATPRGLIRLAKVPGAGFSDLIADAHGNPVFVWKTGEMVGDVFVSYVKHGRRVTERVCEGDNPSLGRSGDELFIGLQEWSDNQAIAYQDGSSWSCVDPQDGSGRFVAVSGRRGGLFWTDENYNWDELESTDFYAWLYPHP
jgi:hypothetical protein